MGLIYQSLSDSDKFVRQGNECRDCVGTKAVAGMEDKNTVLTNRDEKGAGTVVEKNTDDGKKYVMAEGPISNLFTKALLVKYGTGDQTSELNNRRPTESPFKVTDTTVDKIPLTTSNESASNDTYLQTTNNKILVDNSDTEMSATRIRVSKSNGNPLEPITTNPVHAFNEIAATGVPVDFILVKTQGADGETDEHVTCPAIDEINRTKESAVGHVDGLMANESLQIMSVDVIVRYKRAR